MKTQAWIVTLVLVLAACGGGGSSFDQATFMERMESGTVSEIQAASFDPALAKLGDEQRAKLLELVSGQRSDVADAYERARLAHADSALHGGDPGDRLMQRVRDTRERRMALDSVIDALRD